MLGLPSLFVSMGAPRFDPFSFTLYDTYMSHVNVCISLLLIVCVCCWCIMCASFDVSTFTDLEFWAVSIILEYLDSSCNLCTGCQHLEAY